jgi:hypothetical protein
VKNDPPQPIAMVTCRFVRDVGMGSVVGAFKDAFKGLPTKVIDDFASEMESAVGAGGMKKDDEVLFVWMGNGTVYIIRNGKIGGTIKTKESERRLMEVYLTPERGVSQELVKSFQQNVINVIA